MRDRMGVSRRLFNSEDDIPQIVDASDLCVTCLMPWLCSGDSRISSFGYRLCVQA